MQLCIVTQRRRSVHEAELHGLFVLVQCLACQKICARRLQHLHTSGYILQSSRLLPWEALMTIAEKHEVFLFVSSYILCSTRQVEPRVRRTATNCKQHHADAFLRHCLVEPQTHSDTLRHSARAIFKCFLKCVFVMTGAWTSSQTMAMWRVWCSVALR